MDQLLSNPLTYIIIGMIIQHAITPHIKWRYAIAVLPILVTIFGIYSALSHRISYIGILGYFAIAIIFFLMAYTSKEELRKKKQDKLAKERFKSK